MRAGLAVIILLLAPPATAYALTSQYGTCGGVAPSETTCTFDARVGFVGGFCTPTACVPGGFATAGGDAAFSGAITIRAQQLTGSGGGSAHATCIVVAGVGECAPNWSPRAWPMLAPGDWRVQVRVLAGEGAWWGGLHGLDPDL